MRNSLFCICIVFCISSVNSQEHIWFNPELPIEERVEALVDAMTLDEKIGQLLNSSPAIERLGLKPYNWWNECLHGVARNGRATVFPQAIGMAATFDESLIFDIATAISDEARAKFAVSQKIENYSQYAGLTFWSPNVNIFRDPRWGRGQETYGEDPFLTSRIGANFIKGLQGDNPNYLKVAACAKHYVVHSGPEELRHEFDAVVSMKDLWETYLPAFKTAVTEAKVETIMGAYNRTNGESCCASPYLLTDILVDKWGFDGHVVSDCGAITDIWQFHKLAKTPEEASAMAIKSGLQLNCGWAFHSLGKAVEQQLITENEIEVALKQLIKTRFRLGLFDPEDSNPYNAISEDVIASELHAKLSLTAAEKGMVLLKNANNALPLDRNIRNLFVTGPMAGSAEALIGNYYGLNGGMVNFIDGITKKVSAGTTINYKIGQLPYRKNVNPIDWTTGEAGSADACIAVMGINSLWEGEEGESLASDYKGDKRNLKLPEGQIEFLKKIAKNKGDHPLIVVITGGSPIAIPEVYDIADAVIYAWYPGQEGGTALANIIFGDVSPSGKLPFTVPYSVDDLPPYEDYSMKGRTYRYMEKEPQFPFGYGMTYADFKFGDIVLETSKIKKEKSLKFEIEVSNNSTVVAEEVLQVYIAQKAGLENQPISSLKAFKRVGLKGGESKSVSFEIDPEALDLFNDKGELQRFKGDYELIVGNASPGNRSKALGAKFKKVQFSIR